MVENTGQKIRRGDMLLKRGDLGGAARVYKTVIEKEPENAYVYVRLGDIFRRLGNYKSSEKSYRAALKYDKNRYDALTNLGNICWSCGRMSEALDLYRASLEIKPGLPQTLGSMALCLCECGRVEEAMKNYREAIEAGPDFSGLRSNMLLCMNYDAGAGRQEVFEQHRKWGELYGPGFVREGPAGAGREKKRLRVGYVSPDFRRHSVAYFIGSVLKNHSGSIKTFCYANQREHDEVTERIMSRADNWREIFGVSDRECAEMVREDKIDILVDLAGHMSGNRLGVFALKPAPVQVSWLGYPNTAGLAQIDVRLTDSTADPEGEERYYTEELWRLKPPFLCYSQFDDISCSERPAFEKNGCITFGSFNMRQKINSGVVETWADLLNRVEGSRLVLKCKALTDANVAKNLEQEFAKYGIERERITLRGHVASNKEHLGMYGEIDIGLDTFPYNGTTTTCEAMWMGVPVIVLEGEKHAGRVGASLLGACGMGEFIAGSREEYVDKAERLAQNRDYIRELGKGLRRRMKQSRLCDGPGFTQKLETEYHKIWKRFGK